MKYLLILAMILLLPLFGACALINDIPRHTANDVITVAEGFSPDCRVQLPQKQSHG